MIRNLLAHAAPLPKTSNPPSSALQGLPASITGEADKLSVDELSAELHPVGVIERTLLRQLTEHDNSAQLWRRFGQAMARSAAGILPALVPGTDVIKPADKMLVTALASGAVLAAERQSHSRTRSFLKTLRVLLALQAQRRLTAGRQWAQLPPGFGDEQECDAYLAAWWRERNWCCSSCGHDSGYYLAARKAWECRACHRQCGLREGTVMAESGLHLRAWFEAIRHVLWMPEVRPQQLAEHLRISRLPTVRRMIYLIRKALTADDASELLAGLDEHFTRAASHLSQAFPTLAHQASDEHPGQRLASP